MERKSELSETSTLHSSPRSVVQDICAPSTHAVTTTGLLTLMLGPGVHVLERGRPGTRTLRTLILNRPAALHALSGRMIQALSNRFRALESHSTPAVMILSTKATKPAFCAGGDIRAMHELLANSSAADVDDFFRMEFTLNAYMRTMQTPVLSIMDGLVMGGGAGLAAQARFRIATDQTVFAMPECAIGLFPDVGGSYFLPRLRPAGLGMYLALTGSRLTGLDAKAAGFATHFVPSDAVDELIECLESVDASREADFKAVLDEFESRLLAATETETQGLGTVLECFTAESVEAIVSKLERISASGPANTLKLAEDALKKIKSGCPNSVKVTFEAQKRGAEMSFNDCLRMEFRVVARCVRRDDFSNGVSAMVITKDRRPQWNPSTLADVTGDDVRRCFAPLNTDLGIPELELPPDAEGTSHAGKFPSRL